MDFGRVGIGQESSRTLTLINAGPPVRLHGFRAPLPEGLRVEVEDDALEVGGASVQVTVVCAPKTVGPRVGQLELTGEPPAPLSFSIPIRCTGVAPAARVIPEDVAFGRTIYPEQEARGLTLLNVGVGPGEPLRIVSFDVLPLDANTAASEFSLAFPPGYDPVRGIGYEPDRNRLELRVVLTPLTRGFKRAELHLTTNDPVQQEVIVPLSADALPAETCRYRVTPQRLEFAVFSGPGQQQQPVRIENLGTQAGEVCDLTDIALAPASDRRFSLIGGPILSMRLQPGGAAVVNVRFDGQFASPPAVFNGELRFTVANSQSPQGSVPIAALLQRGGPCLVIAPDDLDFGTVTQGCGSSTKTFSFYNTCSSPLTLVSFTVQQAAGQPPGGPNCPGPLPCSEFALTSTPLVPAGGLTLGPGATPPTITARYSPIDVGTDTGAIVVHAIEYGIAEDLVITLRGTGAPLGQASDVYLQPQMPKLDVLFVVDDSTSMAGRQARLTSNFQGVLAALSRFDFHLGVITADDRPDGGQGRLIGDAANPKVLTPTTPDLEAAFLGKVDVGATSAAPPAGFATALKALSAPLIGTDNAGFLRAGAQRSIVLVTDGNDQSPNPVANYVAGFAALGATFSVIGTLNASPPVGCVYDGPSDDGRYAQMVSGTYGFFEDICADWSLPWSCIDCFPRSSFFLNATPRGGLVTVVLDGVVLAPPAYTYDAVMNAVVFPPAALPPPGSRLEIRYPVACL